MNKGLPAAAAIGILCSPLLLGLAAATVNSANDAVAAASCSTGQSVDESAIATAVKAILAGKKAPTAVSGLDAPSVQIPFAEDIVATGMSMTVPARGQVVALATALQESGLRNLSGGDRDSLGLFQQRPSQGWGTPDQIMDPVHASTEFYSHLLQVPGWQQLTVTQAAQAVQQSAYPDAYAKWEPLATALQTALAAALGPTGTPTATSSASPHPSPGASSTSDPSGCDADGTQFGPIPPGTVPAGYQVPTDAPAAVQTAIRWAMGQLGTSYQWGGSCTDAHSSTDMMGHCDCSSLVQQSFKAAGVTLGRTTYDQVTEGKAISVANLQPSDLLPGDLLFTEGSATAPGHVGIYMGDGLVINAPHTGADVDIDTLAFWLPQILAARRVA
ncbi:cell wall-associated NlpC family hydrolase [Streptacidiphilus sp. BW17]|uniref:C40 family peptidase n=1 Tax=Streptacidiphilus sp. BW17 TaxID=3156274 RepID=UPI00351698DB